MNANEPGSRPAMLPAVMMAAGLAIAAPTVALADFGPVVTTDVLLPAAMSHLPSTDFRVPEALANYERNKAEETEISMRMLDWLFGGPVNRCGTTSGCASGWDDSDCF